MAHDTARVSPRLHQTHENWEASHDFPRFSDAMNARWSWFVVVVESERSGGSLGLDRTPDLYHSCTRKCVFVQSTDKDVSV